MALDFASTISLTTARKPPFLHRTWLAAMGSKTRQADHEDYGHRPAKRRRTTENSPDSGIGLEPLDAASLGSGNDRVEKALRIEPLKIQHKDTSRFRNNPFNGPVPYHVNEGYEAKVRCRISISGHQADGQEHHLLVDSQICTIRTYKNPAGPSHVVRIHLPQPFNVPQDKILVPRREDGVFALADRYSARIRLEPAGDANWPPGFLNTTDAWMPGREDTPQSLWVLHAAIEDLFQWHRNKVALTLAKRPGDSLPMDYVLDVDVRWASVLSAKAMKRLDKDVRHSITCSGDPDEMDLDTSALNGGVQGVNGHMNGVNGFNGSNGVDDHHINGDGEVMEDVDDQTEGDLTPGRRRRTRPQINYNLKLLSDKAQKKEQRRRQSQKAKNGTAEPPDDSGVTYLLREQFHMDDLSCVLCGVPPFRNFELLRLHFKLIHDDYAFEYEQNPTRISISRSFGFPGPLLRTEDYQLGPPCGPLDLPAFLEGDETWVTSRQGSDNGKEGAPYRTAAPRAQAVRAAVRNLTPKPSRPIERVTNKATGAPRSQRPAQEDNRAQDQNHPLPPPQQSTLAAGHPDRPLRRGRALAHPQAPRHPGRLHRSRTGRDRIHAGVGLVLPPPPSVLGTLPAASLPRLYEGEGGLDRGEAGARGRVREAHGRDADPGRHPGRARCQVGGDHSGGQ